MLTLNTLHIKVGMHSFIHSVFVFFFFFLKKQCQEHPFGYLPGFSAVNCIYHLFLPCDPHISNTKALEIVSTEF